MSAAASTAPDQAIAARPPYPAMLAIVATRWSSRLAQDDVVPLSLPVVHIGLLQTNDVVLADPTVSRLHAVIRWTARGYVLEDLGSTNGTYVEGQRITAPVLLVPGQQIRLGRVEAVFQQSVVPRPSDVSLVDLSMPPGAAQALPAGISVPYQQPRPRGTRLGRWLRAQGRKVYWKIFLIGLVSYILSAVLLSTTDNLNVVPLVIMIASALVPITFVAFCYEEGAFVDMPAVTVGLTFISGSIVGLIIAGFLENILISGTGNLGFGGALVVGLCEEGAKAISIVWFLRDRRLRNELDGVVLGAAAGMGFAALETAGYGFTVFTSDALHAALRAQGPSIALSDVLVPAITGMNEVLILRMLLAIFGHGVWTAIVVGTIWRDRGNAAFRLTGGVVLAFCIAVVLHALWDTSVYTMPVAAIVGLLVLRFFIKESVARIKLGSMAPPLEPLGTSLLHYFTHLFRRTPPHPVAASVPAHPLAFAGYGPLQTTALDNAAPVSFGGTPGGTPSGDTTPVPDTAAFCPRCGAPHIPGVRFCGQCGQRFEPTGTQGQQP